MVVLQQVLVGLSHPAEDVVTQVPVMGGVLHPGNEDAQGLAGGCGVCH